MGFIGVQPTSAPLTASDITDGIVSNAKLGADSVNATKIADDSISEEHIDNTAITGFGSLTSLADTDKFLVSDASDSGNLKYVENQYLGGGGAMTLLASGLPSSSQVANITFDSVFSTTYDFYKFYAYFNSVNQNADLRFTFRSSGSDISGNYYRGAGEGAKLNSSGSESHSHFVARYNNSYLDLLDSSNNNVNFADLLDLTIYDPTGRDDGCVASIHGKIFSMTSGNELRSSLYYALYANQGSGENYDGGKFWYSSGNIYYSSYQLYGVKKS